MFRLLRGNNALYVLLALMTWGAGCGSSPDKDDSVDTIIQAHTETMSTETENGDTISNDTDTSSSQTENVDTVTTGADDISTGEEPVRNNGTNHKITVNYQVGDAKGGAVVYVIWLENSARSFVQNLYVCERLLNGTLQGIALPYWQLNKKSKATVDGVTGATKLPEITVTRDLAPEATDKFTVFVELDHSWDANDWFGDQPALIYSADIDLSSGKSEFELTPLGWAYGARISIADMAGAPSFNAGELCTEMRYITNAKDGNGFGGENLSSSATNMVRKLTATIQ